METKILPCSCPHPYQDATYGNGKRVHNLALKAKSGSEGFRCTVCGSVKGK